MHEGAHWSQTQSMKYNDHFEHGRRNMSNNMLEFSANLGETEAVNIHLNETMRVFIIVNVFFNEALWNLVNWTYSRAIWIQSA